jgi:thiol-disulfide isomerase/thioredoxin
VSETNPNKTPIKPLRLLALAALLGVLAGAAAVYVKGSVSVHGGDELAQASPSGGECVIDAALKEKVAKAATGDVAAMIPASPSKQLGSLAFNGPDGKPMSIGSLKGKVLLVNLWATWCVPCRAEMPALDQLQAKAGSEKFEVVAVNVDAGAAEKRARFLADTGIKALKDYSEPTMALFNAAKKEGLAFGLPVTMLIGPDGCLIAAMNGPANWASDDALNLIKTVTENAGT